MRNYKHLNLLLAAFLLVVFSSPALAQTEKKITGTITKQSGEALSNVSVTIKGSSHGAMSDSKGEFSMTVPENATLVISYVGYKTKEVSAKDQTSLNIVLEEEQNELSQVVVIGYGTVKKSDLTGSVSSVKEQDLKVVPVTSFDQALQGRAAGVQVTTLSGKPGAETSIRIRGTTSINAGNEP
ncbi:MAG TPA: carboxypeptidase-like regulatory domain-containing protein, partial [Parafilimonas sp.]|nr:carboxypeptidase-like regulatory domain-containing protein [Parafilimonas sp.]